MKRIEIKPEHLLKSLAKAFMGNDDEPEATLRFPKRQYVNVPVPVPVPTPVSPTGSWVQRD